MNIRQTASIGILVVSMGLFSVESANAKNPQKEAPTTAPSTDVVQSSQATIIAQASNLVTPIFGTWKLKHSVGGIVHESVLIMNGYSGSMKTTYFNTDSRKTETVSQKMLLKPNPEGLLLWGYNPVYAGTSIKHPTYSPDNFFFSIPPDGSAIFVNCDDRKQCSIVDVKEIK